MAERAKRILKTYSGILGLAVCVMAFMWVFFQFYLVSQTADDQTDLKMARYLDICFGVLAFFSSLALMYGAFVESKTWISAWILGSLTVVVGMWAWYFHGKFGKPTHPEVLTSFETAGATLTVVYVVASLPVWIFQHLIEYCDFHSICSLGWLCPHFLMASHFRQVQTSLRRETGCQLTASSHADRLSRQYLPTYAQSTTNTFLVPTHTQVHHIPPMSKDEDLYNPV